MKGIIDYEIAKERHLNFFYVPVYYSNPNRIGATIDAMLTDYRKAAEDAVTNSKLYIKENGATQVISYPIKLGGTLRAFKVDFYDH